MKNQDIIDVAQTLIDCSTYPVFDFDKEDALLYIKCRYCGVDIRNDHQQDCVILKALNIINERQERRRKSREKITSNLADRVKAMSGERAVKWIRTEVKSQNLREV